MAKDPLTVSEVAHRSGFAPSALRFYEEKGLIEASRTSGGQRRYARAVLRRLAFVRAASNVGLSLDEIAAELDTLPHGRTPNSEDWRRISEDWRGRLDGCIGCGCLSLGTCWLYNPDDVIGTRTSGAGRLPELLRRPGARERETAGAQRGLPESVVAGG
jgi:MerR family redox-sensitive transcriptional activator SoxR